MQEENSKNATNEKEKNNKYRKWLVTAFIVLVLLILFTSYRGKYLEVLELGEKYLTVFLQNVRYNVITFLGVFVFTYLVIYITNIRIRNGLKPFFEEEKKQIPKMLNKSIAFIAATIISFIVTNLIMKKLMLFINATAFEMKDPILGYDIGYFIFGQPFLKMVIWYLFVGMIGLTIYIVAYYIIAFNIYFDGISRETLKTSPVIKQICNNIVFIAIFLSGYILIETHNVGIQKFLTLKENMNYSLYGAGISEATIKLWGYRILSILVVLTILIAARAFKRHNTKKVIISLMVVPIYLMLILVTLLGFELIFVKPNELDRQKEYIKANIENTKNAYGVNINEINIGENETITNEQIEKNQNVINNIPIVDKKTVLKQLNMLQDNNGYYTYRTSQMANIDDNGTQKLMYMSPREINGQKGTYNNKTYKYTHGTGIILTSATNVDEKGNLVNLQKEFNSSEKDIIKLNEPRIYYGLETNDTAIINKENKEFDYPITSSAKAEIAENTYEGKSGLKINFLDRLILAIKEKDIKIALSGSVNKESNILINRNIIERAKTLLPDIIYDENPYLVVTDEGRLVWVIDGYTVSNNYPYSQRMTIQKENLINKKEINYIRNSVKVLVDSYDGTIKFYITDRNDPIIMAYQKMYKDLFEDKDEQIPQDISKQFIYPQYLYNIQAEIMEKYHNIQTDVLYRGDDIWEFAKHNKNTKLSKVGTEIESYYTMLKTIDDDDFKMGLVKPYTPVNRQNLISYLVGTYENGNPKLTLYKYSVDSNILGPMQIDNQLEQDKRISSEIESLNITGTKIIKNMIIVPIDNSLLYVEPIYQQYINEENPIPILKKVVVASGNKISIGNNVEEALKNLLSKYAVDIEIENTDTIEDLINVIIKSNNNLKKSSENNNWEMIGKDMEKLQNLIEKLDKLMIEEKKKNKNNDNDNRIENTDVDEENVNISEEANENINEAINKKTEYNILNNVIKMTK